MRHSNEVPRYDAFSCAVGGALLVVGILVRVALYFPLAMFPIDSDGVLAGLCAFRIADGQYPAFFAGGSRLSAASCYVAAAFFRLFGPGRVGLALTGLTWGVLYLVFMLLFLRATLGRRTGTLAFVFAVVPSAAFVMVTYVPWAYGEIMASCAATLWLAALWRESGGPWQRLCFGISVGFGIWISLQTLMIALPAVLWILLRRRNQTLKESTLAILGAGVGAAPFLASNVLHGFPSFTANWASQPTSSLAQAAKNLIWLTSSPLPQLLYYGWSSWWSVSTLMILGYVLIGIGFAMAVRHSLRDRDTSTPDRGASLLFLLVLAASTLLYVFSEAGSIRGWTVRYIAPLYVVLPLPLAIGIKTLWRRNQWLACTAAALLLVPNLLLYELPGSMARAVLAAQLQTDVRLRALLTRANVRMVYGDYFVVYHINFDSRENIAAIPTDAQSDYIHYGAALPVSGVRWALLGYYSDQLEAWAQEAGARGRTTRVGDLSLFIADKPAANTPRLLDELRRSSP